MFSNDAILASVFGIMVFKLDCGKYVFHPLSPSLGRKVVAGTECPVPRILLPESHEYIFFSHPRPDVLSVAKPLCLRSNEV